MGLIVAAPLAIGSVHFWTRVVVFALCGLALLLALTERILRRKQVGLNLPLVILGTTFVLTALQLVPLPAGLIASISPATHQTWTVALGDYRFHALSLDSAGTLSELAKIGAYIAFFVAATIYASRSARRMQLFVVVTAAASLVALIGLVQAAVETPRLLFFYRAHMATFAIARGTFVNANHFGALMCLGAPCALTLALSHQRARWLSLMACVLLNVAVVLSLSRSAIAAALIGQAITFALDRMYLRRGSRWFREGSSTGPTLLIAILAALAIGGSIASNQLKTRLDNTGRNELGEFNSKLYAWRYGGDLVLRFPWTGIGHGAFEQAFTQSYDRGGELRHHWVENGYLQSVIDWGAPAALLLFAMAGWALTIAVKRLVEEPLAVGALGALDALAAHEAFDFSIQYPGVALPALALLATLFARRTGAAPEAGFRTFRARAWMLAAPLGFLAVVALHVKTPLAEADADRLAAITRNPATPIATVLEQANATKQRHPADYFIYALVGERLAHVRHPATMAWLNQAMYLNPSHPAPHLLAAELLAASKHKAQALLEYRSAAAASHDIGPIFTRVAARYQRVDDMLAATPATIDDLQLLTEWFVHRSRFLDGERVCERMLALDPSNLWAMQQRTELAIDRQDRAAAKQRAQLLGKLDRSQRSLGLVARASYLDGDTKALAAVLDSGMSQSPERLDLELLLAQAMVTAGQTEPARHRLDAVEQTWTLDRTALIRLHETRATVERSAGNQHQYEWEMEQAAHLRNP